MDKLPRIVDELSAISDAAKRGELLFFSSERAGCFQCHAGWSFSAGKSFFNTGATPDLGKFRPPTLRNIALTAPYVHDGSLPTLEAVIDHYAAGGKFDNSTKSHIVRPFHLTANEQHDLLEFLKSLTDEELLHDPRWTDPWAMRSDRP